MKEISTIIDALFDVMEDLCLSKEIESALSVFNRARIPDLEESKLRLARGDVNG